MNKKLLNTPANTHVPTHATCEFDIEFDTGIQQSKQNSPLPREKLLLEFEAVLGAKNISADPRHNEHYRKGWRSGEGSAFAVLFQQSLVMLWDTLKVALQHPSLLHI